MTVTIARTPASKSPLPKAILHASYRGKPRRLTPEGLRVFEAWADAPELSPQGAPDAIPIELLADDTFSTEIAQAKPVVTPNTLPSGYDMGRLVLDAMGADLVDAHIADHGLWAWWTLFFARFLLVTAKNKLRKGEAARHRLGVPKFGQVHVVASNLSPGQTRDHRHLVRTPVMSVRWYGPKAIYITSGIPAEATKLDEQIMSRRGSDGFGSWEAFIDVVNRLWGRRDAAGRPMLVEHSSQDLGIEAVIRVLRQIEAKVDLRSLDADQLCALLPPEFNRLLNPPAKPKPQPRRAA